MTECETHHEELVDGECESCEWEEHKKKEEREYCPDSSMRFGSQYSWRVKA